jgi:hypothetical protein
MPNQLPNNNRAYVFQTLRAAIVAELRAAIETLNTIPDRTDPLVRVHEYEQLPKGKKQARLLETVPDPVTGETDPLPSFIELGHLGVAEEPYTDDRHTKLTLTFPMEFVMGAARWDLPGFPFPSSIQLFEAVYAVCADRLRDNRTFGYSNVTHYYLQQPFAETEREEDSDEPVGHNARWLLVVTVGGARA